MMPHPSCNKLPACARANLDFADVAWLVHPARPMRGNTEFHY